MRSPTVLALLLLFAAGPATAQKESAKRSSADSTGSTTKAKKKTLGYVPIRRANGAARWAGEPISLDLKDADLRDVLHTFAELTDLNIVVDPEVKGSVTVRLHDVPWDQALDLIIRTNGFGYILEGNILRVGTITKLAASHPA